MAWSFPLFNGAANKGLRAIESSGSALYAEITFRPYWDAGFHLCALATIVTHILRAFNNFVSVLTTILSAPFLIITPWHIPFVPIALIEHAIACSFSLVAAMVTPVFFVFRTITSLFLGYQEDNACLTWDSSKEEEQAYLDEALRFCIPTG